jgi:predicted TIM-barrel fold metal-dependent hydrolase
MRVIDTHVHYGFWDKLFTRDAERGFLEALSDVCEDAGIEKIALLANPGRGNDKLARALEQRPDLVLAMGRLELDRDPVSLVEDFYQRGFHGIKMIGVSKNYDHEDYYPYYEAAAARGLRLLFHTGILGGPVDYLEGDNEDAWKAPPEGKAEEELVHRLGRQIRREKYGFSSARMQPIYLDTIAFYFPELFIIGAHLGWPDYRTACAVARWRPRLYFDISGGDVVHNHIVEGGYIGKEISPRKLLYGSDCDLKRMKADLLRWKAAFDTMGLTEDQQDMIFYRNAAHIFGLDA